MFEHTTLGVFVAAALALLLTPGPAVLYIVTRSVEHGRAAGLVSVLGIWIKTHPQFARGQRYVSGGALIGLGAAAALSGNRK